VQKLKKTLIIVSSIIIIITILGTFLASNEQNIQKLTPINFGYTSGGEKHYFKSASNLFNVYGFENDFHAVKGKVVAGQHAHIELKEENGLLYEQIMPEESEKIVFIVPIFTELAYGKQGFYDYYQEKCDQTCLTVPIKTNIPLSFQSSDHTARVLKLLGYEYITDIEIEKNPNILKNYDKLIVLHNEYVTKKEFDAITSHPNVIYLYPNALYAEISVDFEKNSIILIKGHGYPEKGISNGFNWEFDNTHPFEYDTLCKDWKLIKIPNGIMLNCYPENIIYRDFNLLKIIKEF